MTTSLTPAPEAAFAPSEAQMRLAEALAFLGQRTTITAILESAGVPARTYYHWRRQPGFCRWLAGELAAQMAASAPLLLMNTMHLAVAGNASARALLFRLYIQPLWGARIAAAMAPPPEPCGAAEAQGLEAAVAAEGGGLAPAVAAARPVGGAAQAGARAETGRLATAGIGAPMRARGPAPRGAWCRTPAAAVSRPGRANGSGPGDLLARQGG